VLDVDPVQAGPGRVITGDGVEVQVGDEGVTPAVAGIDADGPQPVADDGQALLRIEDRQPAGQVGRPRPRRVDQGRPAVLGHEGQPADETPVEAAAFAVGDEFLAGDQLAAGDEGGRRPQGLELLFGVDRQPVQDLHRHRVPAVAGVVFGGGEQEAVEEGKQAKAAEGHQHQDHRRRQALVAWLGDPRASRSPVPPRVPGPLGWGHPIVSLRCAIMARADRPCLRSSVDRAPPS
jgi:hypothetical protein